MTYRYLPTISELLDALKVPRKFVIWDKWIKISAWIAVTNYFVFLACVGLFYIQWFEKEVLRLIAFSCFAIIIFAAIAIAILSLVKDSRLLWNPAKEMASQMDYEAAVDYHFIWRIGRIPASVLFERHQFLEAQLARRDKWLDVVRLMVIVVPTVILLRGEIFAKSNMPTFVEITMWSLLLGFAIGAILVRSGSIKVDPSVKTLCPLV